MEFVIYASGDNSSLEVAAEFAWEGSGTQVGLRFVDPPQEVERQLREWLGRNTPDGEKDDPPVPCQFTDLSLRGCYLEIASPFPVSTRVTLSMRATGIELRSEGVVRVMHPDAGMGVEFTQTTAEHRALLEKFLSCLTENPDILPELMVEPEGFETEGVASRLLAESGEVEDPLLALFRDQAGLTADSFHDGTSQTTRSPAAAAAAAL